MKQVTQNALSSYIENVKNGIKCQNIDLVLNLPANFRWYAANNLLTDNEKEVAKIAGVRKNTPDNYIPLYAKLAKSQCERKAYNIADFGKHQYIHTGENVLPEYVKILHKLGLRYSKKYTSTDLYANYFFSVNEKNTLEYLIKLGHSEKMQKVSFFDLEIKRQLIDGKMYDFIFNHSLFKKCKFAFDKKEIAVSIDNETYHIAQKEIYQEESKNAIVIKQIISAFQNRKRKNKKLNFFNNLNLSGIVVSIDDSIKAGNCKVGTSNFIAAHFKKEIENNTPITAEMVWNVRKDEYTKRTILQAAKNKSN